MSKIRSIARERPSPNRAVTRARIGGSRVAVTMALLVASMLCICQTAFASGPESRLDYAKLTEVQQTNWTGKIIVGETSAPWAECEVSASGRVEPGAKGEVSAWTAKKCVPKTTECKSVTVTALHLPWRTELEASGGVVHELLINFERAPGFKVTCEAIFGKVTDECTSTGAAFNTTTANGAAGVIATFNPSEKLHCTFSGSSNGYLEGSETVEAAAGGVLNAVSESEAFEISNVTWEHSGVKLTQPWGMDWKIGSLAISDDGASWVKCGYEGEGVVGAQGAGELSKQTLRCSPAGECEAPATAEAVDLPWRSELVTNNILGVYHDVLRGSGHGAPGFKFTCQTRLLGKIQDTCTAGAISWAVDHGGKPGVYAEFNPTEKLNCTLFGTTKGGSLSGSASLEAGGGGTLEIAPRQ